MTFQEIEIAAVEAKRHISHKMFKTTGYVRRTEVGQWRNGCSWAYRAEYFSKDDLKNPEFECPGPTVQK